MFNQNDYLVRVDMNDLLLRLDISKEDHKKFANLLLANFFKTLSDDSLFEYMYTSTAGHRLKVNRGGCIVDLTTNELFGTSCVFVVLHSLSLTSRKRTRSMITSRLFSKSCARKR